MKRFTYVVFVLSLFSITHAALPPVAFGDLVDQKWEQLSETIMSFAGKIVASNKPAYEQQLTKKERSFNDEYYGKGTSPVVWKRVWAKHKTLVTAWATSNKKFRADYFETVDPSFVFTQYTFMLEEVFGI